MMATAYRMTKIAGTPLEKVDHHFTVLVI